MINSSTPSLALPVALVTVAGDRIGGAIAAALASAGHAVIIHSRFRSDAAGAAGGTAVIAQADLADRPQRARLIVQASEPLGPLSVLVNNASVFEPDSARDLDEVLRSRHFAIHAEAPIFFARNFAAQLPAGTRSNIVNIIDEHVLHPTPSYFSYTLSKSVLWTATSILAQSLALAIRVNDIGPGSILPHTRQDQAAFKANLQSLPLQSSADPDAIAQGVMMLLVTPSMTGQMLVLDSGQHLQYLPRRAPR
ncbi:MAG: SDR family oxidoreductase, partial [Candidatus Devosia symbiotica]|nr:SDR family oxidoreductase [Candidatus Devosia symbiotica]